MSLPRRDIRESRSQRPWIPALAVSIPVGGLCIALARSQGLWYLAFVGLTPLFASIRFLAPAPAMTAGALWGFSVFALFALFGDIPVSHASTHLAALAAIPALYAYVSSRMTRQVGFSPYLLGLGWIGVELALSALGLRNGLLAPALGDAPLLHWVGNFAGAVLIAFIVVYANGLLLTAARAVIVLSAQRRCISTASSSKMRAGWRGLLSELPTFLRQAHPRAPPLRVSQAFAEASMCAAIR